MSPSRKLLWMSCALAAGLAVVSLSAPGGFRRYLRLRKDAQSLEQRNSALAAENQRLVREVQALREEPRALERAAREELGFIKPGEIVLNLE